VDRESRRRLPRFGRSTSPGRGTCGRTPQRSGCRCPDATVWSGPLELCCAPGLRFRT
jgi:hypothetical protein